MPADGNQFDVEKEVFQGQLIPIEDMPNKGADKVDEGGEVDGGDEEDTLEGEGGEDGEDEEGTLEAGVDDADGEGSVEAEEAE